MTSTHDREPHTRDVIEKLAACTVQHGPNSDRVYLMKLHPGCQAEIAAWEVNQLAQQHGYSKIFAKVPADAWNVFERHGYRCEAEIPAFYGGTQTGLFLARYLSDARAKPTEPERIEAVLAAAKQKAHQPAPSPNDDFTIRRCEPADADAMAELYREVFPSYPFPIDDPAYLRDTMASHIHYYAAVHHDRLIALASAETDPRHANVEMTDFATDPAHRGSGLALRLLARMERAMAAKDFHTAYTIARACSYGINITFARAGYQFAGTLINNTGIAGRIESMNVWHKPLAP